MFDKLDLTRHVARLTALFSREKAVMMEGDYTLHYQFINDLAKYDFNQPPKVKVLESDLVKLSKEGVLRTDQLFEFFKVIKYFLYLKTYAFKEGRVRTLLDDITVPSELEAYLGHINAEGAINSEINEELYGIEQVIKEKKKQIQTRLAQIANSAKLAPYMVDKQVHVINGEEALLVRGGYSHVLKATITGRSATGFFYVIPAEAGKLKSELEHLLNRQSEIIYALEKEISRTLGKHLPFLKFIDRTFDRFDHYQARVFFAKANDYEFVIPDSSSKIVLKNFVHPALHNPKPISVDFSKSVLLITGVNAGGKTMLLKSILASALMAKYLIPFRCKKDETVIGRFKEIDAIIDDPQSVSNDISTFAGRIQSFQQLFRKNGVLIGVDEIELGTDSDEASALFKVIIESLIERDCKIVITTHHKRLAALLAANRDVELLAALYDEENRVPTYGFMQGSIGKSYAFETAVRYGIPAPVIDEARTLYGEEKERLGDLIERSSQLELELNIKKEAIEKELEAVYEKKKQLAIQQEETKRLLEEEKQRLNKEYFDAIKAAKEAIKAKDSKEAHRQLNKAHKEHAKIKQQKEVKPERFAVGDHVKYSNTSGVIEKIQKDRAVVDCNGIKMTFPLSKLTRSTQPKKSRGIKIDVKKPTKASVNLDLHGMRAEEALHELDAFINNALMAGFEEVYIYHGVGSGILSRVVRDFLKEHPSVVSWEDAPANRGGSGATIVKF